jgi:hypothetical protein
METHNHFEESGFASTCRSQEHEVVSCINPEADAPQLELAQRFRDAVNL